MLTLCYVVSEAPLRCPLSMVSVLVKDKKETKKLQQAARTRKFRFRRQASMRKVAPKKKSKNGADWPSHWVKIPVQSPDVLLSKMVEGGLINHWILRCS